MTTQRCSALSTSKAKPSQTQINRAPMRPLTISEYFPQRPCQATCTRLSKDLRPMLQITATIMQMQIITIMYRLHLRVYRPVPMLKRVGNMSTSTCCRNRCLLTSLRVSSTRRTRIQRIRQLRRITDLQTTWTNRRTCHIRSLECHRAPFQ